ncbi:hypothetical protein [Sphaerisporangium aureirubrum]|uniref:Secreted protein n=1 Tax=Sphaerisporangium aureirubrum TaxID=1544736 RepID=A0ABW1NHK5_9ACTN
MSGSKRARMGSVLGAIMMVATFVVAGTGAAHAATTYYFKVTFVRIAFGNGGMNDYIVNVNSPDYYPPAADSYGEGKNTGTVYGRYHAWSPQAEYDQWRMFGTWRASKYCGRAKANRTGCFYEVANRQGTSAADSVPWDSSFPAPIASDDGYYAWYDLGDFSSCASHRKPEDGVSCLTWYENANIYSRRNNEVTGIMFPGQALSVSAEVWDADWIANYGASSDDDACNVSYGRVFSEAELKNLANYPQTWVLTDNVTGCRVIANVATY